MEEQLRAGLGRNRINGEAVEGAIELLKGLSVTKSSTYLLAASAALALTVVGCDAGSTPAGAEGGVKAKAARWSEPDRYSFRLLSESGERGGLGEYRITVGNGKVVKAIGLDESARRTVEENPQDVPTLAILLTDVQKARAGEADVAEAVFAADGHPTEIHIDWLANAIDDEADYLITEYRELP
ncbi:DUF6174 domain-containing protein [Streptomyces atratus]|uniref:DUF6174 domain-containing protein n=1 Tax=Streptomyces atratus TaxID=1893 RepID=UPI0016705410|nr:DUF6174 domain-containing protein [Streptomyces atratus]WPW26779.1 DUF6174 domain-containing protein [Streptomyces atratus]GGT44497.1 hypothetical protein GCM10010207_50980 [Streptomyces atratus]